MSIIPERIRQQAKRWEPHLPPLIAIKHEQYVQDYKMWRAKRAGMTIKTIAEKSGFTVTVIRNSIARFERNYIVGALVDIQWDDTKKMDRYKYILSDPPADFWTNSCLAGNSPEEIKKVINALSKFTPKLSGLWTWEESTNV